MYKVETEKFGWFSMWAKRLILLLSIFCLLPLNALPSSASSSCRLTTSQSEITFTDLQPIKIRVNKSEPSNRECRYLYINDRLGGDSFANPPLFARGNHQSVEDFFDISVNPNYPYTNGSYNLRIKQQGGEELVILVNIKLDYNNSGQSSVDFSLECQNRVPGKAFTCTIDPELSGNFRNQITGKYSVLFSSKASGQTKWVNEKRFSWDINNGVVYTFGKSSKPVEIKALVKWKEDEYPLETLLRPGAGLKFSLPATVQVGQKFEIRARGATSYSADCVAIGRSGSRDVSNRFKVTKGMGRVTLLGPTPGDLEIQVMCESKIFEEVNEILYTFIRD